MIGTRASAAALLATLAGCAALLGCGEKGEPETTGRVIPQTTETTTTTENPADAADRKMASASARLYLTSDDPKVCDNVITPEFLRSEYENRAGCVADRAPAKLAQSVQIGVVKIRDGGATVTATAQGGAYGKGENVRITLVSAGAAWLVDAAESSAAGSG